MKKIFLAILIFSILSITTVQASTDTISLWGLEWDHDPLTVYITAPSDKINDIKSTLNDWSSYLESASGKTVDNSEIGGGSADSKFDFTFVNSAGDADIVINLERTPFFAGKVLGITNPTYNRDGYLEKVRINVQLGSGETNDAFKQNVRHEEGHALGLGHASNETDLMSSHYSSTDDLYPSDLDINALLLIYGNDGFGLPNTLPGDIPQYYS